MIPPRKVILIRHNTNYVQFANRGSDRPSNLQALCPNCHAEKTEEDKHRKKQKKIRETEKREKDPLGLNHIWKPRKKIDPLKF